eukprot:TRINITY_DN7685_c0_g1_i1.p1 TRINITY_DN7685_c0_g1~~TRINITY_DN7685_c0_g1_i1.p1  ORF type:complete len:399 (+),score=92.66 TRINITY_DN7685_c0_g1_i1:69-1265(+)
MNGGNATNQVTLDTPKFRLRVARACESCKASHLSCGKERPCARCVRNGQGHLCVDSTPKPRQKRKGNDEKEKTEENLTSSTKKINRDPIQSSIPILSNTAENHEVKATQKEAAFESKYEENLEFGTSPQSVDFALNLSSPSNEIDHNQIQALNPSDSVDLNEGGTNELYEHGDFSPLGETMTLKEIEQMFLMASTMNPVELRNFNTVGEAVTEKVVKHFVRSQWMGEREARTCITAIQGSMYQKATLLYNLTPEQREQIETEKELKFQMTKDNVAQNPMPTIIFNDNYELVFANDAFIQLTGLPDHVMNTLLGGLQCFQFSPETIRAAIWGYMTPVNGPEVYPSFVRMWTNKQNYKTVKIGEHDFLEGTSWAMRYTGPFDSIIFSTRQFLPAPSTIPI